MANDRTMRWAVSLVTADGARREIGTLDPTIRITSHRIDRHDCSVALSVIPTPDGESALRGAFSDGRATFVLPADGDREIRTEGAFFAMHRQRRGVVDIEMVDATVTVEMAQTKEALA